MRCRRYKKTWPPPTLSQSCQPLRWQRSSTHAWNRAHGKTLDLTTPSRSSASAREITKATGPTLCRAGWRGGNRCYRAAVRASPKTMHSESIATRARALAPALRDSSASMRPAPTRLQTAGSLVRASDGAMGGAQAQKSAPSLDTPRRRFETHGVPRRRFRTRRRRVLAQPSP